jgi:hypothetical protein
MANGSRKWENLSLISPADGQLVYQLYGPPDDEIKIVEEATAT